MVLMDKCNGLGVAVFTTNDEDRGQEVASGDIVDKAQIRMAWRRFAHRPVSYNWQRGPEVYNQLYERARDGGEGSVARMLVYRIPKHRWIAADDDEVIADPDDEKDESSGSGRNRSCLFFLLTRISCFSPSRPWEQGGGHTSAHTARRACNCRGILIQTCPLYGWGEIQRFRDGPLGRDVQRGGGEVITTCKRDESNDVVRSESGEQLGSGVDMALVSPGNQPPGGLRGVPGDQVPGRSVQE